MFTDTLEQLFENHEKAANKRIIKEQVVTRYHKYTIVTRRVESNQVSEKKLSVVGEIIPNKMFKNMSVGSECTSPVKMTPNSDHTQVNRQTLRPLKVECRRLHKQGSCSGINAPFYAAESQQIGISGLIPSQECFKKISSHQVISGSRKVVKDDTTNTTSENVININKQAEQQNTMSPKGRNKMQTKLPVLDKKNNLSNNSTANTNSSQKQEKLLIPVIAARKGYLQFDLDCYEYFKQHQSNINPLNETVVNNRRIQLKNISARRYCVLNTHNLEFVMSNSKSNKIIDCLEIASLTKIVTAFLTILVANKHHIDIKSYKYRITEEAVNMPGTSAGLQVGDLLTIQSLLYALMLPSGNDAAIALADAMGKIILKHKKKQCKLSPSKIFVNHMNNLYQQLIPSHLRTSADLDQPMHLFQNPSGLVINPNTTTPQQITLVAAVAYKNQTFREIVSTKEYSIDIKNQRYGLEKKIGWKNSNKLLWKGWEGIKTGLTDNAGACFVGKFREYIVSVFDCSSAQKRFQEASSILEALQNTLSN